jgi:signal transduction histidine kinase
MAEPDDLWIRRLFDIGRALMTELDEEALLKRVLSIAREASGARYAALGVLNSTRTGFERFVTLGIDEHTRLQIGDLPVGKGVLGVLIDQPKALRLEHISAHPRSYGFPAGHPMMRSFLGVPVLIRGEAWGNLYLTEKQGGRSFTAPDEQAAIALADWAAIAIENARLYQTSEQRRTELEQAVLGLQATRDVAIAIGSDLSLEHALELIVKRGRALVGARSVVIMLRDGEDLVVSASAGDVTDMRGERLPIAKSASGQVLERRHGERIAEITATWIASQGVFGVSSPHNALLMPLVHRSEAVGLLAAFDRSGGDGGFSEEDEQLLETFAASAATAVAMAQSAQSDRMRSALAAADAERRRWGRELHDETLQGLGGLRLLLATALRHGDTAHLAKTTREAIDHIEREIKNLRSIIYELRPAALDELGLRAAIEMLVEHHRDLHELQIIDDVLLPDPDAGETRLDPELEVGVYRLVQEAFTNVVKHANASTVHLSVRLLGEIVSVEVRDDGIGFSTDSRSEGFGLVGMRERVRLADGALSIQSRPGEGTVVRARLSAVSSEPDLQAMITEGRRASRAAGTLTGKSPPLRGNAADTLARESPPLRGNAADTLARESPALGGNAADTLAGKSPPLGEEPFAEKEPLAEEPPPVSNT